MKKYLKQNMQLIYSLEEIPDKLDKSIFLAGPTPRTTAAESWRPEFIEILEQIGYDGVVFIPEYRDGPQKNLAKSEQIEWEHKCINACDALVFWVAREMRSDFEMLALTTNIEFGLFLSTGKVFAGCPDGTQHIDYFKEISKDQLTWHNDMLGLAQEAVSYIGIGAHREGTETLVPLGLWRSNQFQDWYAAQKSAGNHLENIKELWRFVMPKAKKLFMTVFKPDVYVAAEKRVKSNEFVVARTNISHVLAYTSKDNILDTKVVLVKEFRSPAATIDGFVHELPGGSSIKENVDPLQTASDELAEEVGLRLDPSRFRQVKTLQCNATLASHKATLFAVELTNEEMNKLEADRTVHGIAEDTEQTYIEIRTVKQILEEDLLDWTNRGMLLSGIYKSL